MFNVKLFMQLVSFWSFEILKLRVSCEVQLKKKKLYTFIICPTVQFWRKLT